MATILQHVDLICSQYFRQPDEGMSHSCRYAIDPVSELPSEAYSWVVMDSSSLSHVRHSKTPDRVASI
jgi:hypothetical protein